jgi:hypothetical protein
MRRQPAQDVPLVSQVCCCPKLRSLKPKNRHLFILAVRVHAHEHAAKMNKRQECAIPVSKAKKNIAGCMRTGTSIGSSALMSMGPDSINASENRCLKVDVRAQLLTFHHPRSALRKAEGCLSISSTSF